MHRAELDPGPFSDYHWSIYEPVNQKWTVKSLGLDSFQEIMNSQLCVISCSAKLSNRDAIKTQYNARQTQCDRINLQHICTVVSVLAQPIHIWSTTAFLLSFISFHALQWHINCIQPSTSLYLYIWARGRGAAWAVTTKVMTMWQTTVTPQHHLSILLTPHEIFHLG